MLDLNGGGAGGGAGAGAGAGGQSSFQTLRFPLVKAGGLRIEYSLAPDLPQNQHTVHFRVMLASSSSKAERTS